MGKIHLLTDRQLQAIIRKNVDEYAASHEETYRNEILKKQADLAFLQAQINPHFLYNSLECIRGQAILSGIPEIAVTVHALSRFFRYSTSMQKDIVSLKDELDSINNYIIIQSYRFPGKFDFEIQYDKEHPGVLDTQIPRLTLQPLVENAIVHGFANLTSGGRITVLIEEELTCTLLTVRDNGCGMSSDRLTSLLDSLQDPAAEEDLSGKGHTGVALSNVHQRLRLQFGEPYGLTFYSAAGAGTDAVLRLPPAL